MTQTNLDAYALANGFGKTTSAMSQTELVTLRYAYVTEQLRLASGDFVKTQDSWANQTRILSMQWQQFMSVIGDALIKVLAPAVKMLNTIVSVLINVANSFNAAISAIFGGSNTQIQQTAASAVGVGDAIGESVNNQKALTDETKATNKEQKKTLAGFDQINKLSENSSANGNGAAGGAGIAAGGGVGIAPVSEKTVDVGKNNAILKLFQEFQLAIKPVKDALSGLWGELKNFGSFTWGALVDFYERFLKPVGSWMLGEGIPRFVTAFKDGLAKINWQTISDSLNKLWEALRPFAINVGEGLLWFWENVLVPFGTWVMNDVVPVFLNLLSSAFEVLNSVWEIVKPCLVWLWDNFLQPIAKWTGGIIVSVIEKIAKCLSNLSEKIDKIDRKSVV